MHIDDIFLPAVAGDLALLRQRLEQKEVDLNELIDCGVENSQRVKVPLLYSVLKRMQTNGVFYYDALELLFQHGLDPDVRVELSSDSSQMLLPVLLYDLVEWKNRELLEFLLKHGASANAKRLTRYSDNASEELNMLYFAISNQLLPETELLLQYGADPNDCCLAYLPQNNQHQLLPPLYYAAAAQSSRELTRLLLQYGADSNGKVDLNLFGLGGKYTLMEYLQEYHHSAHALVLECLQQGIRSKKGQTQKGKTKAEKKPKKKQEKQTSSGDPLVDRLQELIRLENDNYLNYGMWNYAASHLPGFHWLLIPIGILAGFFLWDLLVAHQVSVLWLILAAVPGYYYVRGILKDLKYRKKTAQGLQELRQKRKQLIAQINQLAEGRQVDAWWNTLKPFQIPATKPHIVLPLVWMPSERLFIRMPEDRLCVRSMCLEADRIPGSTLKQMLQSGDYRVLYNKGIKATANYKIADLCHWTVKDGSHTYQVSPSEESIAQDMAAFEQQQDDKERFWNAWEHSLIDVTDEERYSAAQMGYTQMSYADIAESRMWRRLRTEKYEQKLRSATYTKITDIDKYEHVFWTVGVVVLDEKDRVLAVLQRKKGYQMESYTTDHNKQVYDVDLDSKAEDEAFGDSLSLLFHLREFSMEELDVLTPMEGLSREEWLLLLYASYYRGDMQAVIQKQYRNANDTKKKRTA